jgi:N-acetylglucosaminyl-diphospho-decaprenol L-rhamnosyltransferase
MYRPTPVCGAARGAALSPTLSKRPDDVAQAARVHAIVVTWEGAHLIGDCLRSLAAQDLEAPARLAVTVVDNGSTDGTPELVAREFPSAIVIARADNAGFGRATNEGLGRALAAGADYALLVNNDVELEPGFVRALVAAADAHPRAGLLTGTLLFRGEERVNSTGLLIDALGRARDRDFGLLRSQLARPDGPVAGVSGGAALLRCAMLRQIGCFDADYFAYYEDVDLSLRAARAGWHSWYVAAATARHRYSATIGDGSPQKRFLLGHGHLRTLAKHQPPLRALALVPLAAGYRLLAKAPLELLRGRPALAMAEARASVTGLWSALGALALRGLRRDR